MDNYYVYLHIKADTGEPFYVGKGSSKWNRCASKKNRNNYWHNVVNKHGYNIIILEEDYDEKYISELEVYWICQFKSWGFKLVNLTHGGEGISGFKHSEETRNKIKLKRANQIFTEETRRKLSEKSKGRIKTNASILKTIETKIKNNTLSISEEAKIKMSNAKKYGGHRAKLVLNTETGIYYNCAKEACHSTNLNYNTFKNYLRGSRKNKTCFIYV